MAPHAEHKPDGTEKPVRSLHGSGQARSFCDLVSVAKDHAELQKLTEMARDGLKFDQMHYHCVSGPTRNDGFGTYPPDWIDHYIVSKYISVDPVILAAADGYGPFDWKSLDWSGRLARTLLVQSIEYGLSRQGYSIPIHGPRDEFAVLSVCHDCDDAEWAEKIETHSETLELLARALHNRARELWDVANARSVGLSPREVEAVTLVARGLSRAEAADVLNISAHTLRDYINSARRKLAARNTAETVARAIAHGLIVL